MLCLSLLLELRAGKLHIERGRCTANLAQKVAIAILVEDQTADVGRCAVGSDDPAQDRDRLITVLDDDRAIELREKLVTARRKLFAADDKAEWNVNSNFLALRLQTARRAEGRQHDYDNGCKSLHRSLPSRRRLGARAEARR